MQRCPKCWSAVDVARESACSQCGEPVRQIGDRTALQTGRRRKSLRITTLAGVLVVGGSLLWLGLRFGSSLFSDRGAVASQDRVAEREAAHPDDAATAVDTPPADAPGETPQTKATDTATAALHWRLRDDDDAPVDALLAFDPARPDGVTCWLPLHALPLEGDLRDPSDASLTVQVIHLDRARGFVLLHVPGSVGLPETVERARLAASTSVDPAHDLRALSPTGSSLGSLRVVGRTTGSDQLQLDRDLPSNAVLLGADGDAIGYVFAQRAALTFDAALPWLAQASGMRALADVQRELREIDPAWLLREAGRLLSDADASVQSTRRAIDLCAQAAAFARDRDTIELANERQAIGWQSMVRVQARSDRTAAIGSARAALAIFPEQDSIRADLVRLLAANEDIVEAFDVFDLLRQRAIDAARSIVAELVSATRRTAAAALRRRAAHDAVRVLSRAVSSLPDRADLRMAYAEALRSAGNAAEALAHARHAAALDATFAARVEEFDTADGTGREVIIGFDPDTHAIDADVSIAGTPVRFIVDTGASMTTIPTAVARSLGLLSDDNRKVTVNTASGQVVGEIVQIPWIQIGTIRLARVRAVVIDLPNDLAGRGLLGMNVLRSMDFEMDAERGRLRLRKK